MSIYVFITRKSDPLDDSGPGITADEWLRCIEAQIDFRTPRQNETEWLGNHAKILSGDPEMAFDWVNGQIEVKNPPEATIRRMKQLAEELHATVFSETGELYDIEGRHAGFLPGFP
jgi:hypothetical protein